MIDVFTVLSLAASVRTLPPRRPDRMFSGRPARLRSQENADGTVRTSRTGAGPGPRPRESPLRLAMTAGLHPAITGESGKMKNWCGSPRMAVGGWYPEKGRGILCSGFASLFVFLAACGCDSSHPGPTSSSSAEAWREAVVAVVQCLVNRRLIPDDHVDGWQWLKEGEVHPDGTLTAWLSAHADTVYGGKKLHVWEDEAIAAWPNWTCPFPAVDAS